MQTILKTLAVAVVLLSTSVVIKYYNNPEDQPLKKSLSAFPQKVGEWQGKVEYFDDDVYEKLGVDDSTLINYQNNNNETIQLYIGYYKSQRKGDLIHSPKNCMPGAGWNIADVNRIAIKLNENDIESSKINKLILQKGNQRLVALYWFHSRGRLISSEYHQKIYLALDSIIKHRTDGSFIRIISPVSGNNELQTTDTMTRFIKQIIPILNDFIPS